MNQQKQYTCQDISHENDDIQGHCLNFGCKDSKSQFCLQCAADPMKHTNCKKDLKGFGQIQNLITKSKENLNNLGDQLNKSFAQVKTKFEEYQKQIEKMNKQLIKISEYLSQQEYQQIKENLQSIKEWYQYLNNQDEITKTQLINVKRMIKAFHSDYQQQQSSKDLDLKQDFDIQLHSGIELLNKQKWQQAYELLSQSLKQLEKQQSFATFFQCTLLNCLQSQKSNKNTKIVNVYLLVHTLFLFQSCSEGWQQCNFLRQFCSASVSMRS
ncbi:unnamed protein product [Paramecium sonneborni]|uniref:Uncharacterized protein n=1 Tax=Paramecium sonneborni TaxID=65129 RepID=A0A8S1LA27_9CILI|nr:unnamed protein product [Paramecium sonneborni]